MLSNNDHGMTTAPFTSWVQLASVWSELQWNEICKSLETGLPVVGGFTTMLLKNWRCLASTVLAAVLPGDS